MTDQTEQKPKRYLDYRFDITDLSEDQVSYLWGEVAAQAERSEGHPSVEAEGEIVDHPVEDEPAPEPRTILVHLNVEAPGDDPRTAEQIISAVEDIIEVGSDNESVEGLTIVVALAEEI